LPTTQAAAEGVARCQVAAAVSEEQAAGVEEQEGAPPAPCVPPAALPVTCNGYKGIMNVATLTVGAPSEHTAHMTA
jgi:hypothetical protein